MSLIKFEYMYKNEVMSIVTIDVVSTKAITVSIVDNIDNPIMQFLGKRPHTIECVNDALEDRCFDRHRPDGNTLLSNMGLTDYDPLSIVHKTHGAMLHDFFWIRFDGEDLTWDDVNLRKICSEL